MKNLSIIVLFALLSISVYGQDKQKKNEKAVFTVNGVCGDCESRILKAGKVKGVKIIEWDKNAQQLTVFYNTKKTSKEEIAQSIADIGHDTQFAKADDEDYKSLPGCCQYRDGVEVH